MNVSTTSCCAPCGRPSTAPSSYGNRRCRTSKRDYLPLPTGATPHVDAWQVLSGAAALGPTPPDEARPSRLLSYDFESSAADIVIRGSFPLPVPEDEFLGITLPLRQDRSWHALRVELEVGGRLYRSADDLFLDRYR